MKIVAQTLTRAAFAEFGDVLDTDWDNHFPINAGRTERYHDLATAEAEGGEARTIISIFRGTPCDMPHRLTMVERHPLGSQAFMPLSPAPFLVIVCPDEDGVPGTPRAFVTAPSQGVNYRRGIWHGVLTPLGQQQDFIVVDRAGDGINVEVHHFDDAYDIHLPYERSNA